MDLTGQKISSSYNNLAVYDTGTLTDGTGSLITNLDVSSSYADESGHSVASDVSVNADSASYVLGSSVDGQVASSVNADTASYVQGSVVDGQVVSAVNADTASFVGSVVTQDFHLFDADATPVTMSFANGVLVSVT